MPRHKATDANPFKLTLAEATAMRAFVRLGNCEGVAEELGVTRQTATKHITRAVAKIGAPNRVAAAVLFDRRVREDHAFVGKRFGSIFAMGASQ